jgi:TorA maturation chaperone TorD
VQAEQSSAVAAIPEEERLRAELYVLLARLLSRAPDETTLDIVRKLKGGEGPIGEAVGALSAVARAKTAGAVDDEYHDLFIGLDQGEVVPYASHYLTGRLYDAPLAKLRADMAERGIGWDESIKEPEDHIAALCEMMAGLILGAFGEGPASIGEQRSFYEAHLAPWAGDFFTDLAEAEAATFYMPLARLGSHLLALEHQAFRLAV